MAMVSADMKIRSDLSVKELIQTLITLTFVFPRQKTVSILMNIAADELRKLGC